MAEAPAIATPVPDDDEADPALMQELMGFLSLGSGTTEKASSSSAVPSAAPAATASSAAAAAAQSSEVAPALVANSSVGLVGEAEAKVTVERAEDATAAYYGAKTWEELNLPDKIMDGIHSMGFTQPSKIQEWALPIAMQGGNIIGQAQNGSGKTAAFALAMLTAVDPSWDTPQGLCICQTRELAVQNHDVVSKLGKYYLSNFCLAVPQPERFPRSITAQIIVGTPGKLNDLIKKRIIDSRNFKVLVLDEADVMIDEDNSMGPQVMQIRQMLPSALQVILFSATYPDRVEMFAKKMVPKANRIIVQKEDLTLSTIKQTYIDVGDEEQLKFKQLSDLYGALNIGQSIIFVNTRDLAFGLARRMKNEGHSVSLICGTQKSGAERVDERMRDSVMTEFRNGVTKVLISTDVLARGIDVPAVTLVVNYELPIQPGSRGRMPECEQYIHRIGRTGRFGLKGVAVNIISSTERPLLETIQKHYGCTMTKLSGDVEEVEELLRGLR